MMNLRVTKRQLTDGSWAYAVKFEARHEDASFHTVTIECQGHEQAENLCANLNHYGSFAETDAA